MNQEFRCKDVLGGTEKQKPVNDNIMITLGNKKEYQLRKAVFLIWMNTGGT